MSADSKGAPETPRSGAPEPPSRDIDLARVRAVLILGGVPWHSVDDGVQQVRLKFLELEHGRSATEPVDNVSAWSGVVASRVAIDWHRGLQRRDRLSDRLKGEWALRPPSGDRSDVEFAITLADALEGLTPIQRQALVLRFYEDLTVRDIADSLGIREGTVKSRLHDATRALQVLLRGDTS